MSLGCSGNGHIPMGSGIDNKVNIFKYSDSQFTDQNSNHEELKYKFIVG